MKGVIALVLAGGRMGQYGVLTQNRAKGALTFGGTYRIVDFALSSLRRSRIEKIGLIIQYLPSSLIEHVGVGQPWDLNGYGRALKIMPPFVGMDRTDWYKGTADALRQNWNFVEDMAPEHVVVLSGEHVFSMNFAELLDSHRDHRADLTMVVKEMPPERCTRRFGYVETGEGGRVEAFVEKPDKPPSNLASTGTYVFRREVLEDLLRSSADSPNQNLAKDLLSGSVAGMKAYAHPMADSWEYLENVDEYYWVQMRMLLEDNFEKLRHWGVLTNQDFRGAGFAPAAYFGVSAEVTETLAGPGCRIDGRVERSILSPGVTVEKGAVVRDSILMHDCAVRAGATVENTISDRDAEFCSGCHLGIADGAEDAPSAQLVLVGKGARLGAGARVPRGRQVAPRVVLE
jgi:glucose-1-phosphate adenylyltransferase